MNKTQIKNATTQQLIERLIHNEGVMVARNGCKCKKMLEESRSIAKELSNRNLIELDSFVNNLEL